MRDGTPDKIAGLITNYTDIESFQTKMQGPGGVHSMGHFTIAGDPGSDFYTSAGGMSCPFFHYCLSIS
jgi:tyrosinase